MKMRQCESVKNLIRKPPIPVRPPSVGQDAEAVSLKFNRNLLRQRVQCAVSELPKAKKMLPPYKPIESLPAVVKWNTFKSPKVREGIDSSIKKSEALSPTRSIITLQEDQPHISLRQHTPSLHMHSRNIVQRAILTS